MTRSLPRGDSLPGATALLAALVAALLARPTAAHGDADEASVHVELGAGIARVADALAPGRSDSVSLVRGTTRFTYAIHNDYAFELRLSHAQLATSGFADTRVETPTGLLTGELTGRDHATRMQLGLTGRFGAAYVPTVHLAVGPQLRRLGSRRLDGILLDSQPSTTAIDLAVSAGAGFDLRWDRHWLFGITLHVEHARSLSAPPLTELSASAHVSYYWYPRWFPIAG